MDYIARCRAWHRPVDRFWRQNPDFEIAYTEMCHCCNPKASILCPYCNGDDWSFDPSDPFPHDTGNAWCKRCRKPFNIPYS